MEYRERKHGVINAEPTKRRCMYRYKKYWEKKEEFRGWLCRSANGEGYAHCKACDVDLLIRNNGKIRLQLHGKSRLHREYLKERKGTLSDANVELKSSSESKSSSENSEDSSISVHASDVDAGSGIELVNPEGQDGDGDFTFVYQPKNRKRRSSNPTVEALRKVATALQQVAGAIQTIADWLPHQNS